MKLEIERKFKVNDSKLTLLNSGDHIVQGYLSDNNKNSIRVRRINDDAYLTIKNSDTAMVRSEFEYPINLDEANYMLKYLCLNLLIKKTRYKINFNQHVWFVDKFEADNKGLVLAEIELGSINESFEPPEWLLEEVTNNSRYYNSCLAKHPFSKWAS